MWLIKCDESNVSVFTCDGLTERSYKLVSEAKDRLVKHHKTKKDSKLIRRSTPSHRACHWTGVTQQQQNCLQITHLGNIIDSPVQNAAALWGLVFRASKVPASKRTTQVAETILSPQKAFQPGEELDGICRAGICKGGSPGEVRLSLAMGLATWVQGTIKRLCSRGAWLVPKTDKATKRCLQ